ncbi:phosphatase PAP2 family protein [Cupriavidus sp. 30B13]|uniref:phosphatase PAP2 family protein n=1 Tax=Cupriavidus sp. 30B13 TaxID=3384241 RepID=UPI003B90837C
MNWYRITDLGDAAVTLPLALTTALWLLQADGWRAALRWVSCLAAGAAAVLASKLLNAGCGMALESFDMRVISGHAMLSAAVWSVFLALLLRGIRPAWRGGGLVLGLALATLICLSRVLLGAHTPAEVVAGWLLGAAIAGWVVRACARAPLRLGRGVIAGAALLGLCTVAYGRHAPLQQIIWHYSPYYAQVICYQGG